MKDSKKFALMMVAIANTFAANPTAEKVYHTEDGNCFLEKDKSHGEWHARSTKQTLKEASREDFLEHIENITKINEDVRAALEHEATMKKESDSVDKTIADLEPSDISEDGEVPVLDEPTEAIDPIIDSNNDVEIEANETSAKKPAKKAVAKKK